MRKTYSMRLRVVLVAFFIVFISSCKQEKWATSYDIPFLVKLDHPSRVKLSALSEPPITYEYEIQDNDPIFSISINQRYHELLTRDFLNAKGVRHVKGLAGVWKVYTFRTGKGFIAILNQGNNQDSIFFFGSPSLSNEDEIRIIKSIQVK